jgi:hypothetical protein
VDDYARRSRLRSFLLGGLLGSAAAFAAAGRLQTRRRAPRRTTPKGLEAFEGAPCFREVLEHESRQASG